MGYFQDSTNIHYYFVFALIGLTQSICFPAFNAVTAAWFSSENRGIAVVGFCTSVNIGNIIGAQLAALLLKVFSWYFLLVLCGILFLALAVVQAAFLV